MKILILSLLCIFVVWFVEASFAYRLILVSRSNNFSSISGVSSSCPSINGYYGVVLQQSSGKLDRRRFTAGNCRFIVSRVRNGFIVGEKSNCPQDTTAGRVRWVADFSSPNVRSIGMCGVR